MKKLSVISLITCLISSGFLYGQGKWTTWGEELNAGSLSSGNLTTSMIEDKNGNIVVACYKGTFLKYDGKEWTAFDKMLRSKQAAVWDLPAMDEKNGYIWFVSNSGTVIWDGNESYSLSGLVDDDKRMMYSDDNEKLVTFYNNEKTFFPSDVQEGFEIMLSTDMYSVLVDNKNRVWIGTLPGVIYMRSENGIWQAVDNVKDASDSKMVKKGLLRINKLFEDTDGNVWVVTSSGVGKFDSEMNYSFEKSLEFANSIFQDSKENIWIGSVDGVTRFDGSAWKTWGKEDGIEDVRLPYRFQEDKNGNIWFCSKTILATRKGGGLYRFNGSKWDSFKLENKGYMSDILIDKNGDLWCTTLTGVYQYKNGEWNNIRKLEGFAKFYHQMYEASNGDIWFGMSTIKGMVERYTP
jgi:ligand-binding sensor domain-containing protein